MARTSAPASAAAAAVAASDLNYLMNPLHWTAVLRHPRFAGSSAILFRLYTVAMVALNICFFSASVTALFRDGTENLDAFTLTLSTANTNAAWQFRIAHTFIVEDAYHKLSHQVGHDFAEFLTWDDLPLLRSQSRVVRRFSLTYVWSGIIACAYYLVSPVSPEGLPNIMALPFDAMQPLGFAVAWLLCSVVTLHAVVMTMVLDSLNVSIIAQLRIQLILLSTKIVNLAKEIPDTYADSSEANAHHKLRYRLEKCIRHHQAIIKNADLLERSLGSMLLAQSLSIGASTCFQMFQLATRSNGLQQTVKFGCYLFAMLAELFVYCWFGDDLITESENVAHAAYDAVTSLHGCPLSLKKSLVLLMHRAQRPLRVTAGGFFPLSRESFVSTTSSERGNQYCHGGSPDEQLSLLDLRRDLVSLEVINVSYSFFAILRNFKVEEE